MKNASLWFVGSGLWAIAVALFLQGGRAQAEGETRVDANIVSVGGYAVEGGYLPVMGYGERSGIERSMRDSAEEMLKGAEIGGFEDIERIVDVLHRGHIDKGFSRDACVVVVWMAIGVEPLEGLSATSRRLLSGVRNSMSAEERAIADSWVEREKRRIRGK